MNFSLLQMLAEDASKLKDADGTDAGKSDVINKAHSKDDISFTMMRNAINADGEITGSDVADYIERAEELNDEIDTIAYGLETSDGQIVKVYINAEQADKFEDALGAMLGVESDIEDTLNTLAGEFDIVDVIWPTDVEPSSAQVADNEDGPTNAVPNQTQGLVPTDIMGTIDDDDEDDEYDEYDVIAAIATDDDGGESVEIDADELPDVPENEEGSVWAKLNDLAIATFGTEEDSEILSIDDLSVDQLGNLIDLDRANELAAAEEDGADFQSLEAEKQEEIINANPDLIQSDDEEDDAELADGEDKFEEAAPVKKEKAEAIPEKRKFSLLSSL